VLGHSDEIFEEDDLSGLYDGADLNYSVFVFKPSLKRFDQLLQYEAGRKDGKSLKIKSYNFTIDSSKHGN